MVWAHFVRVYLTFDCCQYRAHGFVGIFWLSPWGRNWVNELLALTLLMQSMKSFPFIHCLVVSVMVAHTTKLSLHQAS